MARSITARLILCALGLTACGGGRSVEINPKDAVMGSGWNATLASPSQLAGVSQVRGTAWMAPHQNDSTKTDAAASIANAVPGGEHPWHVHVGQCGNDRGIFGPANAYKPLEVKGNGTADAKAELPLPLPVSGQYFVNVHASANNMGTIIACGNLAPPSR